MLNNDPKQGFTSWCAWFTKEEWVKILGSHEKIIKLYFIRTSIFSMHPRNNKFNIIGRRNLLKSKITYRIYVYLKFIFPLLSWYSVFLSNSIISQAKDYASTVFGSSFLKRFSGVKIIQEIFVILKMISMLLWL